jgi:phage-related protein
MDIPTESGINFYSVQWWKENENSDLVLSNSGIQSYDPAVKIFEDFSSDSIRPEEYTKRGDKGFQFFSESGEDLTINEYPYVDYSVGVDFKKDDILKIEELIFSEESDFKIGESKEVQVSSFFRINPSLGYSANGFIRKVDGSTELIDEYKTYLTENQDRSINFNDSIGVGIGLRFYDESNQEVYASNLRNTSRLMAGSELNNTEYYNVFLDVPSESIPQEAFSAKLFLYVCGLKSGSFEFSRALVRNFSQFFYCVKDHKSSYSSSPNSRDGLEYWTQDFIWRPSYGSKSDFVAKNDELKMGEGQDYVTNMAINSLPMELSLSFNNRTDKEAKAIIHFLQEKSFAYDSIFSIDYKGDRLLSSEVGYFNFKYTYPYKDDLKYTCTQFSHSISYRNNNNINAKFVCNTESTLSSVESHAGYNKRIDALIPIFIDEKTEFKKGEQITLNTFTLEQEDGVQAIEQDSIINITRYPKNPSEQLTGGIIRFTREQNLEEGDCVYIKIEDPQDSVFNVGKTNIRERISETEYVFGPILEQGSDEPVANLRATSSAGQNTSVRWFDLLDQDKMEVRSEKIETTELADQVWKPISQEKIIPRSEIYENEYGAQYFEENGQEFLTLRGEKFVFYENITFKKMQVCPEDCLYSKVVMPEGVSNIPSQITDPETGEVKKRQVYLKNYRRMQIDSDINENTLSVKFTPLEDFTLNSKDDFWLLISAAQGRSSIYFKKPDDIVKFPWLEVRNFDHKPSLVFTLDQTPEHIQTKFLDAYKKKYKKGINSNLSVFNLTFEQRSDQEAAEILQFLESHLGFKKFRFQMPRPYLKDFDGLTSPSRPNMSTFYCPSWGHDVIYKNNHSISVTFIESATSVQEDILSVFGVGSREEEKPCYGAEIQEPITRHELCTFSSQLQAASGQGFNLLENEIELKNKSVDLVFIVDTTGSMTDSTSTINGESITKYHLALDIILKMITSYDGNKMPGTKSFSGEFDAPALSYGSKSGDNTVPPWPADGGVLNSLIASLYDPIKKIRDSLDNNGYNLENLDRFTIKIDKNRVNIGFILMGDPREEIIKVSDYPNSFDKVQSYKKIRSLQQTGYKNSENMPMVLSQALAQFYNSPRAEHSTDRIIIMLTDAVFTTSDATIGTPYKNTYTQTGLNMCAEMRGGGSLAKRRPSDTTLRQHGFGNYNPYNYLEKYKKIPSDGGRSQYNNPDNGSQNPSWYDEDLPTIFMLAQVGIQNSDYQSIYAPNYVYDYDKPYPYLESPGVTPQFFFPITKDDEPSGEVGRMFNLINVVKAMTNESGYQNIFSVILYNCGPFDVKILNTIINTKGQSTPLKWTTEILKEGIIKGGSSKNIQYLKPSEGINSIVKGYGGQYFDDQNNEDLFSSEKKNSNILWESFNTKYEVLRQGRAFDLQGGWSSNSSETKGVENIGVASKGMPVRVFKADSGLEIVDYNIGSASHLNEYKGNYSHLPMLKPGEKIDLFFGIKTGGVDNISEEIQMVFNSDDGTHKGMYSYANYEFSVKSPSLNENSKGGKIE